MAWTWNDQIKQELHNHNESQRTAFPARVVGVASSGLSVTIEIANPRYSDDGINLDSTHILTVPVCYPRTQNSLIRMPIKVGDTGLCVVCDNNIDNTKLANNNAAIAVRDDRMKDVMDSVFIPGFGPFALQSEQMQALQFAYDANDLVVVHNTGTGAEVQLVLKADGNAEINSAFTVKVNSKAIEFNATDALTINAKSMNVNVANTTWTGTGNVTGEWVVNKIPVSTHVHLGVTAGNGVSGLPRG